MALRYTKDELEQISVRLQCCAVDAAKEALTAEMFLDREKNKCAWNKFKFLQRTSNILKEYIPGGLYTYQEPLAIENEINPSLSETYQFKGATVVDDILSPYYGFAFSVYGEPDTGDTFIYVIYNGELHSIVNTVDYTAPYMRYIQSIAYDSTDDVLLLGASASIQEYSLAPLLLPSPGAPTALGNISFPSTDNFYAAHNRISNATYFSNTFPAEVKKYFNTGFSSNIPVSSTPTHIAVNSLNGETWVVCGTDINIINPFTNTVTAVIDMILALGAYQINKITFSPQLNMFIVPWFDGVFTYRTALMNPDGTVYTGDIYQDSNTIYQGIYYQQLEKYIVGADYQTTVLPDNYGFSTEFVRTILNDTKNDKVIICTENCIPNPFDPFSPLCSSTPFRITILSAEKEEVPLCLNDADITGLLETAQHYCCDCCPNPVVSIANQYDNPFAPEPLVVPGELKKIYYGYTEDAEIAKNNPQSVLLMANVNRYNYQGVYNPYNPAPAYIVFALPVSMGIPSGFLNHVTSGIITMVPTVVLYSGVPYRLYVSTVLQPTNISLEVY
jgi:hypothetical protein